MNTTRKLMVMVIVIAVLSLFSAQSHGAIFQVTNSAELQSALDTARTNGQDDTIKLLATIYETPGNPFSYGTASNDSKTVTLSGGWDAAFTSQSNDPQATVLDGAGLNPVLQIDSNAPGVNITFIIENLTIQNGYARSADYSGGGILTFTGQSGSGSINLTIRNCLFQNNNAANNKNGGAIYNTGSIEIYDSKFLSNIASSGGAMLISYDLDEGASASPIIDNCYFEDNSNYGNQGSTIWTNCATKINNCTFKGRSDGISSSGNGSCIWGDPGSHLNITNSTFSDITIKYWGPAIQAWNSDLDVTNCLFTNNRAGVGGNGYGAVNYFYGSGSPGTKTVNITNCTFSGNTDSGTSGAVHNRGAIMNLKNCIFWDNSSGRHGINNESGTMTVTSCDAQGGYSGTGNFSGNPQFGGSGDYSLRSSSPCIDRGNNSLVPADILDLDNDGNTTEASPLDLKGQTRFYDDPCKADTGVGAAPIVDIGAFEYIPVSETIKLIEISQGLNYGKPGSSEITYGAAIKVETDNSIKEIEFITAAGYSFVISNEPETSDGNAKTTYSANGDTQTWLYQTSYNNANDRNESFGEGTYDVVVRYQNDSSTTTSTLFGATDVIPQPTQKPTFSWPGYDTLSLNPIPIIWQICTDPNVNYQYLTLQDDRTKEQIVEGLDKTTYLSQKYLNFGKWNAGLAFIYGIPFVNEDGVAVNVAKYTMSEYSFVSAKWFGTQGTMKNVKLTLKDSKGADVTFALSGGGYGLIDPCDSSFGRIELYGITDKSALTISTKSKAGSSVGSIICNGPMKSITAKNIDITGEMIIGFTSNPKAAAAITFDQSDDLAINSDMPIKSINAYDWKGSLTAPSVGSITIKKDIKQCKYGQCKYGTLDIDVDVTGAVGTVNVGSDLKGSWDCQSVKSITAVDVAPAIHDRFYLTLSQKPDPLNPKTLALGKLTVKGKFCYSRIISSGNIGTITVGGFVKSSCFAGVDSDYLVDVAAADGVYDLPPASSAAFNNEPATIKSFTIKGIAGDTTPCFYNSNIAAANILSASLFKPADAGGADFGVTAGYIKSITIKDLYKKVSYKNLDVQADMIEPTIDDVQIRLY
jgi:hypothetical protein